MSEFRATDPDQRQHEIDELEQLLAQPSEDEARDERLPIWFFQFLIVLSGVIGVEALVAVAYEPTFWMRYLATALGAAAIARMAWKMSRH